jgi:hypothetical protein
MEHLTDHVEDPREGQLTTRPPQGRCPGSRQTQGLAP